MFTVNRNLTRFIAVFLVISLLFGNVAFAAEKVSLFQKLKAKVVDKIEKVKDKEWLIPQLGGKVAGLLVGKPLGLLGMGLGFIAGTCIGGPTGGALGAWIGYRVVDTVASTFAKPVGKIVAEQKMHKRKVNFKEAWKSLDKKALAAESAGNVVGEFIGDAIGVAAGVAFFAGAGNLSLPLIGIISGEVIGKKIGGAIGRSLGRAFARKAVVAGFRAFSGESLNSTASVTSPIFPRNVSSKTKYEAAYKKYISAQNDPKIPESTRQQLLKDYQKAFADYQGIPLKK